MSQDTFAAYLWAFDAGFIAAALAVVFTARKVSDYRFNRRVAARLARKG